MKPKILICKNHLTELSINGQITAKLVLIGNETELMCYCYYEQIRKEINNFLEIIEHA